MISIKTEKEIAILEEGGAHLSKIVGRLSEFVKPGISTLELNILFENEVNKIHAKPSFKNYRGYPSAACISINEEVVHGIPNKRILRNNQIISIDVGMIYKGLYTDMAITVGVGDISKPTQHLIDTTQSALYKGIKAAKAGKHLGDISYAIQEVAQNANLGIIRDLTGHGVGYKVHEEPSIPNYGAKNTGPILKPGMVLALEPMFSMGDHQVKVADDGWTVYTKDRSISAHFEHTIVITKQTAKIITVDKE
ncbi:type I methionyl aminopeptidase [Patescibacteria group bacterium]